MRRWELCGRANLFCDPFGIGIHRHSPFPVVFDHRLISYDAFGVGTARGGWVDCGFTSTSDILNGVKTSLPANAEAVQMKRAMAEPTDIDAYIAQFPSEVQQVLRKVRATIRAATPKAREVISYKMPAFRQHGILVYFAAWKNHIGLYPPISGDAAIVKAAAKYAGPKGNLQFPLDEPMPYDLIKRIVKLRVRQDNEKVEAKRGKRKRK